MKITFSSLTIAAIVLFAACNKADLNSVPSDNAGSLSEMISENGNNPDELSLTAQVPADYQGHVYTESNDGSLNAILVYNQDAHGFLHWASSTPSGGKGLGIGLGSQGAVVISEDHHWLFAVNAASNSVSSFAIDDGGSVTLKGTAETKGKTPVSVCFYDNRLYVANTKSGDVEGFWLNNDGSLTAITGSYKSLSAMNATPGEIAFSPGYHSIIVTEKMTNKISSFPINNDGSLGERGSVASVGHTPFGFDFSREKYMIVSNANADLPYQASCTSYGELNSLHPMAINGTVENMQTAACWVAVTKYGRFAFVANSLSNSISSYFIQFNGNLYVVNKVAGHTGEAPIDLCVSGDNLYVYNINSKTHTIGQFKRGGMGILTNMGAVSGLPQFAAGMAAF